MSDEPRQKCIASCKDGSDCEAYPIQGKDKCRMHAGTSSDGESHEDNENSVTHGAFKEKFRSDLEDDEKAAISDLVDHLTEINDERTIAAECAAEALMKYKRSADSRFLREARQWFADFNLIPNEMELSVQGDVGTTVSFDEQTAAAIRSATAPGSNDE